MTYRSMIHHPGAIRSTVNKAFHRMYCLTNPDRHIGIVMFGAFASAIIVVAFLIGDVPTYKGRNPYTYPWTSNGPLDAPGVIKMDAGLPTGLISSYAGTKLIVMIQSTQTTTITTTVSSPGKTP